MSMTRLQIKQAAIDIHNLRVHGTQNAEIAAAREEREAMNTHKVATLDAEEYERRKKLEEERELRAMERGDVSVAKGHLGTTSQSGYGMKDGANRGRAW